MTAQALIEEELVSLPSGTILYRFNGVPVVARPDFWPIPFLLTGLLTWAAGQRHPKLSQFQRFGLALLAMPVALFADVGHAMAHTVSARLAGAPMDEILLSSGMPRTLYRDNAVQPKIHVQRSLGGPIFSFASSMISLLWWRSAPRGSLSNDLASLSLFGHSFIFLGSLAPLPMVDGGTILKWKLVEAGHCPDRADQIVKKTDLRLGIAFLGLGLLLSLFQKRRLVGALLAVGGMMGIAAGNGRLK